MAKKKKEPFRVEMPWQFRTNEGNWRENMHLAATLRRFADFLDFLGWEEVQDYKDETILKANKLPILIDDFDLNTEDDLSVTLDIYPRCASEPGIKGHMPSMDMRLYCDFGSDGKDKIVIDVDELPYICKGEKIAETVAAFFTTDDTIPYDDESEKDRSIEFKIDTRKQDPKKVWANIKNLVELRVNRLEFISSKAVAEMKKMVKKFQLEMEKDFGIQ